MLGTVALLSFGILAYDRLTSGSASLVRLEPEPLVAAAPTPATNLEPSAPPPQAKAAPLASSVTLVRPPEGEVQPERSETAPARAKFAIFRIAAKTHGRWVVSNRPGSDVDSPSIARVIFSAADGDVILLKPGLYVEPLAITRKKLTLRGLGARPEEVLVTSPDRAAVLTVDESSVKLENLRLEPMKGYSASAAAVRVRSGKLDLLNVTARSQDVAILASQGRESETLISAASSLFEGGYADLEVRGQARVALKNVRLTNPRQPIVVWRDVKATIKSCQFVKTAETRLFVYEESSIDISGSPTAPAVARQRSIQDAQADTQRFSGGQSDVRRVPRLPRMRPPL